MKEHTGKKRPFEDRDRDTRSAKGGRRDRDRDHVSGRPGGLGLGGALARKRAKKASNKPESTLSVVEQLYLQSMGDSVSRIKTKMWNELPWQKVPESGFAAASEGTGEGEGEGDGGDGLDHESFEGGEFEEDNFFGIEEIDGSYVAKLLAKKAKQSTETGADVTVDVHAGQHGVGELTTEVGGVDDKPKKAKKKKEKKVKKSSTELEEKVVSNTAKGVKKPVVENKRAASATAKSSISNDVIDSNNGDEQDDEEQEFFDGGSDDDSFGDGMVVETIQLGGRSVTHNKDNTAEANAVSSKPEKNNKSKKLKAAKQAEKSSKAALVVDDERKRQEVVQWGSGGNSVTLARLVAEALQSLNFEAPTPIQHAAIPVTLATRAMTSNSESLLCDVVGVAETGSGKTLAFGLPILNTLVREWSLYGRTICPMSLIIAPTRELAMQISSVMETVAKAILSSFPFVKINVVSIVGGLSEQKQRRQLVDGSRGKRPIHVLVATPGRLCELMTQEDEELAVFQNMSEIRYLVVDEVDRIVEEGHFSELSRIFSRIRDHEHIAASGRLPQEVARQKLLGTVYEDPEYRSQKKKSASDVENDEDDVDVDDIDLGPPPPDMEDVLRAASEAQELELGEGGEGFDPLSLVPYDDDDDDDDDNSDDDKEGSLVTSTNTNDGKNINSSARSHRTMITRQTLLYSATAGARRMTATEEKKLKKHKHRLKDIGEGAVRTLPFHIQELLALVAVKKNTQVVNVSKAGSGASVVASDAKTNSTNTKSSEADTSAVSNSFATLPKTLSQFELRIPIEEKDIVAYYYLLKHAGRTLVFVNSIKTARRLDGLLRALGLNCRTIHAELQQKQRLKALDSFKASPIGVLVATDVAARGLDIPKITSVMHYDIARSPQLYVHRSGRTARANTSGTAVSLVAPDDAHHHTAICQQLARKSLETLKVDLAMLPLLRERVTLAKKIFTQSFVESQASKESLWLQQTANDADLGDFDDFELDNNKGKKAKQKAANATKEGSSKKELQAMRARLTALLNTPLEMFNRGASSRRTGFIVVAK